MSENTDFNTLTQLLRGGQNNNIQDTEDTEDNNIDSYINDFVNKKPSKVTKAKAMKKETVKHISTKRQIVTNDLKIEPKENTKYTLAQGRKDSKEILSKYYKEIELFLKNYQLKKRKNLLTDDDVTYLISDYDNLKEAVEDELNLLVDLLETPPPDSFYDYLDKGLDRQKKRIEKIIN
tara:strand:- start:497 stop:1030 length:534 start_codon:yes stop_codon:yes gene_type:complete